MKMPSDYFCRSASFFQFCITIFIFVVTSSCMFSDLYFSIFRYHIFSSISLTFHLSTHALVFPLSLTFEWTKPFNRLMANMSPCLSLFSGCMTIFYPHFVSLQFFPMSESTACIFLLYFYRLRIRVMQTLYHYFSSFLFLYFPTKVNVYIFYPIIDFKYAAVSLFKGASVSTLFLYITFQLPYMR